MKKGIILSVLLLQLFSCTTMKDKATEYTENQPPLTAQKDKISEKDLMNLPFIVQKYFRFSKVLGKSKISSFSVIALGKMRDSADSKWLEMEFRQQNRLDHPSRVFYIESLNFPTIIGIDSMLEGKGKMEIQLLRLFGVGTETGKEMDESALTTYMNDLVFCPSSYFTSNIEWKEISDTQALAILKNESTEVSALLTFKKSGELIRWESSNRYATIDNSYYPDNWSTVYNGITEINGMRVPSQVSAIHNYDDNPYVYGVFDILSVETETKTLP